MADKTLASRQSIYESDFVGSTRNALAGQNHRDRRMIEEDSSSGRWHRSHRLQFHVRGKGWQLRWITARHTVSSKLQSCCRERMTLYACCYDFIVLYLKCAFCQEMIVPSAWIDSRCWKHICRYVCILFILKLLSNFSMRILKCIMKDKESPRKCRFKRHYHF